MHCIEPMRIINFYWVQDKSSEKSFSGHKGTKAQRKEDLFAEKILSGLMAFLILSCM